MVGKTQILLLSIFPTETLKGAHAVKTCQFSALAPKKCAATDAPKIRTRYFFIARGKFGARSSARYKTVRATRRHPH
jgi:hypothetical protein